MKAKSNHFKKKILAASISSCVLASVGVQAQDGPAAVEEVQVFGIRASLQSAMDTKRNATGVVDAISAEDIGKFPDTNLAESLQRITGVSISRVNGEGSQITVRGFGGDNNMVTLNGRQLPGGGVFGGGAAGNIGGAARAFDFANLASEAVSGIEVYKTGRAEVTTGGIGATVNIKTSRPLDNPGLKASIGGKLVNDTSNEVGDDITPELSGIVSYSTDVFGVALTGSFQERDSGFAGASVNDWNIRDWQGGANNMFSMTGDGIIVNEPEDGQYYARPNDLRYEISDTHRERTNAQLTVQFAPNESITGTIDYTYAENMIEERRSESTIWMANDNSVTSVTFDNSPVATPILIEEDVGNKDNGMEQTLRNQTNTLDSFGLNLDWQVTDSFSLTLDAHDSSMESEPTSVNGTGEIAFTMGIPNITYQTWNFGRDLPDYDFVIDDSEKGNNNGVADIPDVGSQILRTYARYQKSDLNQVKLDGELEFENGKFQFGVESRTLEVVKQENGQRYMALGDWGIANPGDVPDDLIHGLVFADRFDDYTPSDEFFAGGDAEVLAEWAITAYGDGGYEITPNQPIQNDDVVKEDTTAAYFQVAVEGELGDMPINLVTGLRYETTDVESVAILRPPAYLTWLDNNDFNTAPFAGGDPDVNRLNGSYDNMLPSLDFDISFADDLKGRFSYSKTIARAGLTNLFATVSGFGTVGSTFNGAQPTANRGDPSLVPLESNNFDISTEWYFDDTSYASIGLFEKRVSNFIGTDQIDESHFGIRDQTNGALIQQAADELEALGVFANDTSLFVMAALLNNPDGSDLQVDPADASYPDGFPGGAADFVTFDEDPTRVDPDFAAAVATDYDIPQTDPNDPLMIFRTATPVGNREAKLYGAELAVQHFFGDTGFGVQANYTIVRGDIGFNDEGDPSVAQFALTGLSDTANMVLMYEDHGIQARLAYNWRDEYLNQVNRGNSRNPTYVEAYDQIDLNVSYSVTDNLSVSFEGLNIAGSDIRHHGRTQGMLYYLNDLSPRYTLGARYTF